jgi:hypothetical protein
VGKGLDTTRRILFLGNERRTNNSRVMTLAQNFISHHTERGKVKREILSTTHYKKEVHLRSKTASNP